MKLTDLLEERTRVTGAMRTLHAEADAAGALPPEKEQRFGTLKTELESVEQRIQRQTLIDDLDRRAPGILLNGRGDGAYEDRARGFSLVRAIRARCGDRVDDGAEREISQEVERRAGRAFQGIAVPDQYFLEQRTLVIGSVSPPSADALYQTQHRPDLFIDVLRSQLVVGRLGATVLNDLVGDQEIPRQTASSDAQHVAEDSALSETDAEFDDVRLTPKTVGSVTSFSRRALINATPSVEGLVRRDLAAVIANAIDFQAVLGDGSGNTPVGVVNDGATSATLATPSWAQVLAFISAIQSADADLGSLGWLTNPRGVTTLRSTNKVAGEAEHGFIMTEPGNLAGYPLLTTTAVPLGDTSPDTTSIVFGSWSQLIVGYWSGIDVLVNPYSDAAYLRGRVQVRAMRDYDVAVRHGAAFAVAEDLDA